MRYKTVDIKIKVWYNNNVSKNGGDRIMKQFKYDFYIGLYDKDTKKQEYSNQYYYNTIAKVLSSYHIDNYTLTRVKGCYKTNREPSIIITLISKCNLLYTPKCISDELKELLNQESILLTNQELEVL